MLSKAVSICNQIIGNTITKTINEGIVSLGIHNQPSIISAATGTDRISLATGPVKVLKNRLLPESMPQIKPKITAKINPIQMCDKEFKTASQNSESFMQLMSSLKVCKGRGISYKSSLLALVAAICHNRIQKIMDPAVNNIFLSLVDIVEAVSR